MMMMICEAMLSLQIWINHHDKNRIKKKKLTLISTVPLLASFATRVIAVIATACPNAWTPWRMVAE